MGLEFRDFRFRGSPNPFAMQKAVEKRLNSVYYYKKTQFFNWFTTFFFALQKTFVKRLNAIKEFQIFLVFQVFQIILLCKDLFKLLTFLLFDFSEITV